MFLVLSTKVLNINSDTPVKQWIISKRQLIQKLKQVSVLFILYVCKYRLYIMMEIIMDLAFLLITFFSNITDYRDQLHHIEYGDIDRTLDMNQTYSIIHTTSSSKHRFLVQFSSNTTMHLSAHNTISYQDRYTN